MAPSELQVGVGNSNPPGAKTPAPAEKFQLTFVESPFFLFSLVRQIRERMREPKITVPQKYYRGEATLPVVEMKPWYRDIPNQIKVLFEKPKPPLIPLTSHPIDVPDIWQDYEQQPVSWLNSLLVHAVVILALIIPFIISGWLMPVKAKSQVTPIDISPYLGEIPKGAKKMGGGGGGGDRSPTPASKGAVPKFAKVQFAPPTVKPLIITPKIPVTATLLGPPELKLPEMQANAQWGDPKGVLGPASNGPGFGGGIGSGSGGGIGSGNGGGLGPGNGGGTGGGAYSVGGGVSAPKEIYAPSPDYSEEARKAKFQGAVVLSLVVDAQGNPTDIQVVRALGMGLDEKAVEKVRTWKFVPGKRNGTPVPVRVLLEVTFRLF
ncbi:MAG: energy transducer TonB [Terriglobia bacterium]